MFQSVRTRFIARTGVMVVAAVVAVVPSARARSASDLSLTRSDFPSIGSIAPTVFDLALSVASCAVRSGVVDAPQTLTVIDYSRPSTAKRLWTYGLTTPSLLYEELVAHGSGSGDSHARVFSNTPDSHQTSLGLFVTGQAYTGKNGYSMRMDGLDAGFNDRARDRAIVFHGADYVSDSFARAQGRLGRSWGCPVVREAIARQFIDAIKGGSLVFSYYPDPAFLARSKFVQCATAAARP